MNVWPELIVRFPFIITHADAVSCVFVNHEAEEKEEIVVVDATARS
jgi:hypothetical protein